MKPTLGEFEEIVLLLVAVQHNEAYGLSITNAITKKLQRSVTLSSVHTALYRLEEKGFVQSKVGGSTAERGGRSKRIFILTSSGKNILERSREVRKTLWDMIPQMVMERL